ncbi:MAG: glycosyltransferase family 4 protein [Leptolyngbyaceae cyanobacterium T60_A2020_046]|nr:glycosyltransferase family 4 protein [Leptolyngbyaceae cyanobacterium T60_A2020_046]
MVEKPLPKPSIAVWQPYFLGGGAEAVALWILEALVEKYDVTLFTLAAIDLDKMNRMYDTHLKPEQLKIRAVLPQQLTDLADRLIANSPVIRLALIYTSIQALKSESASYDLVFSAYNAVDLGCPGVQYLHWVNVVEQDPHKAGWWLRLLMKLTDFSRDRLTQNVSLANSRYTADRVYQTYGIHSEVVYPPVVSDIQEVPWEEKEDAFLCSGRVVVAKQTHRVINIVKKVRDRGFDVKLHITGGGGGAYRWGYQRKVEKLAAEYSDWVYLHQNLPYRDYLEIVAQCRYGIHYKSEPFGISVAEMVKAGMIPFVRSRGGQVEIIGEQNTDVLFNKEPDAVEKIIAVLESRERQTELLSSLENQKPLFSTERFMAEIDSITHQTLVNHRQGLTK